MTVAKKPETIKVTVLRRLGIEDNTEEGINGTRMIDPSDKPIEISKDSARKLQDAGAVRIVI